MISKINIGQPIIIINELALASLNINFEVKKNKNWA